VFGAKQNWRIEMSASRILGLMVVSAWLAVGCSGAKKIDVGGACILNSDCNSPLVCTMGKCHDACHTSADCPTGQSCVKTGNSTICQLPAEGDCSKTASCGVGFVCASDQRCRTACQSSTDCTSEQACLGGICHDSCQVSADCPTGQSCVKTNNTTLCQLPAEADCSKTLSCSGAFVCAPDLRCRTACQSRTDCTTEQMCVSGVCAAPADLDPHGQLPQKGPSLVADGGTDVRAADAGGQGSGADGPLRAADVPSLASTDADGTGTRVDAPADVPAPKLPDAGADLTTGMSDATGTPSQAVALFHFDGTEGSTNLTDSSGTGKVATITGNPIISTVQSKFGGASLYVNGGLPAHRNYVLVPASGSDFTFAGDYTIDYWLYVVQYTNTWGSFVYIGDSTPAAIDFSTCGLGTGVEWSSSGGKWCHVSAGLNGWTSPTRNAWHHVAVARAGVTTYVFVDGHMAYQAKAPGAGGGAYMVISGAPCEAPGAGDNGDFNGYIDELRVVKGLAVWTSDFIPPTAPYTAANVLPVDAGTPDLPPATPDSSGAVPVDAASDASGVPCGTSACTGGGCCVVDTCVASGATCSTGGTCAAGSCGSSASLSVSPASLDFGSVTTGQSSSALGFTILNNGQQTSGAISVTSDNADFAVQTGGAFDCVSGKTTLAPNTACTVRVVFSPNLALAVTGTVTISATPGGGAGVGVSGTSACSADYLNDGTGTCVPYAGVVWTQTGAPPASWVSVAASSDGTNLVAVSEYLYTSENSGVTWTQRSTTSQAWSSVAMSSDGTKLVATVSGGYIYTSGDSGTTWTQQGTSRDWTSVASSSDGTKLVAVASGDYIYTSGAPARPGARWASRRAGHPWRRHLTARSSSPWTAKTSTTATSTSTRRGTPARRGRPTVPSSFGIA
jgi:hypothetical protein